MIGSSDGHVVWPMNRIKLNVRLLVRRLIDLYFSFSRSMNRKILYIKCSDTKKFVDWVVNE